MMLMIAQISGGRAERLRVMHSHFNEPDPNVHLNIAVALGAILAILAIVRLLAWLQSRRGMAVKAQPMSLYLRVQAQMGLSLLDRWRLWRLAKSAGIPNPTALLISPVLFDRAVARYTGSSSSSPGGRLGAIRKRLFGHASPLPTDAIPEAS